MDELEKLYNINEDFKRYIDNFCLNFGCTKETAFTHKVIKEDIALMYTDEDYYLPN